MGLGLNAASDPRLRDYSLARHAGFVFVPENASEKTILGYKKEFAKWIISNGLREMEGYFTVFLEGIYHALLLADVSKKSVGSEDAKKRTKRFERKGVLEKLNSLESEFGYKSSQMQLIEGLTRVRNCLTHRRGIVGKVDCTETGKLVVRWKGVQFYKTASDGIPEPLHIDPSVGTIVSDCTISVGFVEKRAEFPAGSEICLESPQLAELALGLVNEAKQITRFVVENGRAMGISVTVTPPHVSFPQAKDSTPSV